MKKQPLLIAAIALIFIGAVALIIVQNRNEEKTQILTEDADKVNVLVSILPQKEIVESVGGDLVTTTELVHPGESPATYSLTAQDLIAIEKSDVYFRIGYIPFEQANIEKIRSTNQDLTIVQIPEETHLRYFGQEDAHDHTDDHNDTSDPEEKDESHDVNSDHHDIHEENTHDQDGHHDTAESEDEHHDHSTGTVDPHLWLSIDNMMIHTDSIAATLSEIDPEHASIYAKNAQSYKNELSQLKSETTDSLSEITSKKLLVFHPAWGYFADEHGLMQIAIEHDGNDPTAEQLSAIIDQARENDINVVFVQSQFSTAAAQNIAETLGVPVVQIDPLAENYIENMRVIANTMHKKLQ